MSKKMKWIAAAIAILLLGALGIMQYTKGNSVPGMKHIILHIKGVEKNQTVELDTESETLAEALKTQKELKAEIADGPYGAYLVSLNGEKQNQNQGPWWVYESSNNEVCLSMEYCPALEQILIKDKDEFTFSLIDNFE